MATRPIVLAAALFVATVLVYSPVAHFDFVNFDDPDYVTNNVHVQKGLTMDNIVWALTSVEAANWLPLTRLSELLDFQLFSMDAGWHHAMNALYHALATLLLFLFLNRATRAPWPSAFVALVFGLHPLHVESVAWISERKDVLCALFFFLSLYFYVRYAEYKSAGRYAVSLIAFVLALMSKPMAVTLPIVLVLLDYWPLRRPLVPALKEKLPFAGLAVAAAVVTIWVQQGGGAVRELANFPLGLRIENALVSYVAYIVQMLWPANLAVFYPYPSAIEPWQPGFAALLLAAISVMVVRLRRTQPYLLVGWLWYLITLLPVIGLVQVGVQARADRYTYFTTTGLCIMIAWGMQNIPVPKPVLATLAAVVSLSCVVVAFRQIQVWKNSETLFSHAIAVTGPNYLAEHNLGVALASDPTRLSDAIQHYRAALQIEPNSARAHTDLGTALSRVSLLPEAVAEYRAALQILPNAAIPHNNLGNTLSMMPGHLPEAIVEYETALRLQPGYEEARGNLATAHARFGLELAKSGHAPEAIREFEAALQIRPEDAETHNNLGVIFANMPGREPEALAQFEAAVRLDPNYPDARVNLGIGLLNVPGRKQEGIEQLRAAMRLKPDPEVQNLLNRIQ